MQLGRIKRRWGLVNFAFFKLFCPFRKETIVNMKSRHQCEALRFEVSQIPMEDFFRNSERTGYQISPDGKHISFMAPYHDRMNIFVQSVEGGEALRLTSET